MFLSGGRKTSRFVADQIEKRIQVLLVSTSTKSSSSHHHQRRRQQRTSCTHCIINMKSFHNSSIEQKPPTGIITFHQNTTKNSTSMRKELRHVSSSINIPSRQRISNNNNNRQAFYQMMSNHHHHHHHHHHNQQQRRTFLTSSKEEDDISASASAVEEPSPRRRLWEEMSPETQKLAMAISRGTSASASDTATTAAAAETNSNNLGDDDDDKKRQQKGKKMMHPRVAISRAITLMESKHPFKKKQGDLLLTYLLSLTSSNKSKSKSNSNDNIMNDHQKSTIRVGFAGPPGAGKSCMMEAFGMKLLQQDPDLKLAVVCIDPSSSISGGSILGDKTRMTQLSREVDRAFVRPSSNSGILGGLAAYTDDVVRLLGCAGYPLVFVETVGLGQSEMEVAQSVDVLVLLIPPSGGDELQGVKKGIVEMANILAVTKTDGDLENAAFRTASDYKGALSVLHQSSSSSGRDQSCIGDDKSNIWKPPVILTSSITERGLDDLWQAILRYKHHLLDTEKWDSRRRKQSQYWMWEQFTRMMQSKMQQDPRLWKKAKQLEREMLDGLLTPRVAAQKLLDGIFDIVDHK